MAARPDRWHFTREQLQNTPSRKCGVEPEKELSYRQQSANLIQDMGQRLQVNQLCINTAIVYMHRFYMFQPFTRFPRNSISPACLFLAAKVEEQPHKLEHVLKVAHLCLHRSAPPLDPKSDNYMQQSQELVINESIILQTFAFDVAVSHPHTHVVKCTQMIRASKDLAQTSYFMATNSLHLTTFCLQYKPTIVACVCVHLACKWSQYEIPKSSDGNYWWEYVDPNVTVDLLDQLTMEFLQIIEACPNRLKRRITIHKEQTIAAKKNKKEGSEEGSFGTLGFKPGSQSSIDSGIAELDDPSKFFLLPPHVGSPWLTKPSKDDEKSVSEPAGKPGLSGRIPGKVDAIEGPQPTKKTLEEYRLEKEKKRKLQQEQKVKEDRMRQEQKMKEEQMRQAKMKRKAYEAQLLREGRKERPKMPPQAPTKHGDQHSSRHLKGQPHQGKRPPPPPPLPPPSAHGKESSRHHPHHHHQKEHHHPKTGVLPMKNERMLEERKVAAATDPVKAARTSGSIKPPTHTTDMKIRPHHNSPTLQKHQLKKEPVGSKNESTATPSLLHKAQVVQEKSQAQRDEDKRLNDELSDIRDEIMKELENDTSNPAAGAARGSQPTATAPAAAVEKKRNSLDNLRQVAREELMHLKKSGIENRPHPAAAISGIAGGEVGGGNEGVGMKLPLKVKEGNKGGHEQQQPHSASSHSPIKKLKSPVKMKRESLKSTTTNPSLSAKGETPVIKKRALDLGGQQGRPSDGSSKKTFTPHVSKQDKNNGPLKHSHDVSGLLKTEILESKAISSSLLSTGFPPAKKSASREPPKETTIRKEPSYEFEEGEISTSPIDENKLKKSNMQINFATDTIMTSSAAQGVASLKGGESRRVVDKSQTAEVQATSQASVIAGHLANSSAIKPEILSTNINSEMPETFLTTEGLSPLRKEEGMSLEVTDATLGGQQGPQHHQSPKHKHKHKEKKKHKKHRQVKPVESSAGSPNVESTSTILTTSGGIKLKIKGLSSSFSGGSPSEPLKAEPLSNSAGHLHMTNTSSPNSGKDKEHKHRHKHGKSKSHRKDGESQSRKRSLSPAGAAAAAQQAKRRMGGQDGGEAWAPPHPELPGSLLNLPMPPPDPKKVSPSKHSTGKHKRKTIPPPPPPPPKAGKESPPPPPPPPPRPPPGREPSSPLTTVTALPSMDAMPMDPYTYSNQYFTYPKAMPQGNNGNLQSSSKPGSHRGHRQPRPPPYS